MFDDEYYSHDVDMQKPVFEADDDDGLFLFRIFHLDTMCSVACYSLCHLDN